MLSETIIEERVCKHINVKHTISANILHSLLRLYGNMFKKKNNVKTYSISQNCYLYRGFLSITSDVATTDNHNGAQTNIS
jgi:hypothetical protein